MSGDHCPARPQWDCDTCGSEWPCVGAKKLITDLHHGAQEELSLRLLHLMAWAAENLNPGAPAQTLPAVRGLDAGKRPVLPGVRQVRTRPHSGCTAQASAVRWQGY